MAEKSQIRMKLAESTLFAGVSSDALDEIASIAKEKVFQAKDTIRLRGEPADACSIISSGAVDVYTTGREGTKYEIVQLGQGDSFTEIALLTEMIYLGTMIALEETTILEISRDDFRPILLKHPDVIDAVGKGIQRQFHRVIPAMEREVGRQLLAPYMSWLDFVIIVGLSLIVALGFNTANQKGLPLFQQITLEEAVSFVSPLEAFEKHKKGQSLFVDAMPTSFYEKEHIPGAENIPLTIFDFIYDLTLADADKEKEIIVYGRSISRHYDEEVANKLSLRNHKNVKILKGGLSAWKKAGCPVEP
jgi:CRP-like cAMP-binding protein/rhodanese-related sulfurtransferase